MGVNLLIASIAICAVSCILGQIGLRRLQYVAPFPLKQAWAVGLPCAWIGLLIATTAGKDEVGQIEPVVGFGFLSALLLIAALIDAKTTWAPTEIILPICILAPTALLHSQVSLNGLILLSGIMLFAAVWGFWLLQNWLGTPILPPADAAALSLPMIVFKESEPIALYFFLLAVFLILIKLVGHRIKRIRFFLESGKFPLLALAFPILLFLIWGTFLCL